MGSLERLAVRVNDELVLDAGVCETFEGPGGPMRLVRPARTTLFHQLIAYLKAKPDPRGRLPGTALDREGVAAAAMTLRWGSYLAVLADRGKPLWRAVREPCVSRVSDDEMARINIEASAAMAEWIDLYRADPSGHARLVDRAVSFLPMPSKTSKGSPRPLPALASPEMARRLEQAVEPGLLAEARADVERHPSRVLANALVNVAWRNGPVEDIHAGVAGDYPLDRRRVTPAEVRSLMRFSADGMALGMTVCLQLALERPPRPWPEQVLPYRLATMMLVTPSGWTLTETSREVRLPSRLETP
jgi:hypothetical protein